MGLLEPPRWPVDTLQAEQVHATALFRNERMAEPLERYTTLLRKYEGDWARLLAATNDLRDLLTGGPTGLNDGRLLDALRYAAGPPISLDDLKVVGDVSSVAPRTLQTQPHLATRLLETILLGLDGRRFPWIGDQRAPSDTERQTAILASAVLMATQRVATNRRSEGKAAQEARVRDVLRTGSFAEVPTRKVSSIAQAPRPGEFCGECDFGSRKADIVVGLWDGRVLPIECKVSNSATNSIKRLNNDAAIKAETWRKEFGELQVVPTAVLSGVYSMRSLETAQRRGLTLFWAHRLEQMMEWIARMR